MNDVVDRLLEPSLWFLANWSGRWAILIVLAWVWLRFLPPRQAAIRHLICLTVLFLGLALPMLPTWELAVWTPSERRPSELNVSAPMIEADTAAAPFAEPLTAPEELPPDSGEPIVTTPSVTTNDHATVEEERQAPATRPEAIPRSRTESRLGVRRYLVLAISAAWMAGVLLAGSRLAYGLSGMRRLRREAVEIAGPSQALLAACRASVSSKRDVRLATHPLVSSPLALGLVRPVILVPEDWPAMSLAARRASLIHELQHLANYDDWLSLLRAVVGGIFFFHPLVHWLLWRIGQESELVCDDAALAAGIGQRDYARLLLRFAQRPTTLSYRRLARPAWSVPFGSRKTIKGRLLRLLDSEQPWTLAPVSFRRRLLVMGLCVAVGGAMSGITLKAAPQESHKPSKAIPTAPLLPEGAAQPVRQDIAAAATETPKRVAKKRWPDAASRGGRIYDTEPMPVSIKGIAKDHDGRPLPKATVYVAIANGFSAFGQNALLAQTTTDDAGKYLLKDVMLPVRMFPPQPEVVEGKFQVFGVSDGHGFAWHGVRAYRPRPRPAADSEPGMDRAYYQGEAVVNDLVFGPTVRFAGQVKDDLGNPLAGAKVQIGLIDEPRRPGSKSHRFQLLAADDSPVDPDRDFTSIHCMPESRLSATTDAEGRYQFPFVLRNASFIAAVSAAPELGQREETVSTENPQIKDDDGKKTVIWNPVFTAPRSVTVSAIGLSDKQHLNNTVLHAYGRSARFAGNEARCGGEGRARLRLPPGHYRLVAEPASGSLFVRSEQEIDIANEPIEQEVEMTLQPGSLVVLKAMLDDATPVEGVGFSCETDTSKDRRELQSQTVFVDHPTTSDDGLLRAVVEPGRRRFFVSAAPKDFEAADGDSPWTELAAGQETTVILKLRKKPQADERDSPTADDDVQRRLQLLWRRQNEFKFKGTVTYRMTRRPAGDYVVTRDEIRQAIATFDVNAGTDIAGWINQQLPELSVRFAGPYQMVIDGQKHRQAALDSSAAGTRTSIEVFNGAEIVRYDATNAQVSVDDHRVSSVHIDGPDNLRHWPLVPRPIPAGDSNRQLVSRDAGKVVFEWKSDAFAGRQVVDEATGFVYEESFYRAAGNGRDTFQFAPIKLANGMIWPGIRVVLDYHNGELYLISIHDISSVEPTTELPADAFVVSVPAGTVVLASEFGAAVSPRDRNHPGSHKQGMATGRITDAVQFAYSLSPKSRSLWPVLKIGQDAPALNAAAWLTKDGEIKPPDLKGKIVLVDFWGQSCGPCVAELPKLATLAKHYAKTDLQIVGWHDSRGDMEGVAQFARKYDVPYILAIDHEADEPGWFGALFKSYGVRAIPQSAVLDRQGKVVFIGTLTEAISRLESVLSAETPAK